MFPLVNNTKTHLNKKRYDFFSLFFLPFTHFPRLFFLLLIRSSFLTLNIHLEYLSIFHTPFLFFLLFCRCDSLLRFFNQTSLARVLFAVHRLFVDLFLASLFFFPRIITSIKQFYMLWVFWTNILISEKLNPCLEAIRKQVKKFSFHFANAINLNFNSGLLKFSPNESDERR